MSEILDGPVLAGSVSAAEFGSGTGGLLVVVLLGAVSIGLFVALSGSLKRMRANVESGQFPEAPGPDPDPAPDAVTDCGDKQANAAGKVPGQGRGVDAG